MKKIFNILLVLLLVFTLVSCDEDLVKNNGTKPTETESVSPSESSPVLPSEGNTVIPTPTDPVVKPTEVPTDSFNFSVYYLNDTHGAILSDGNELGMASIGNFIKKDRDENSLFITGGDIFQGQLISNDNKGALFIEIFNELELDAFVVGNHEFDWGLDVILEYFDPNTDGVKANFPLLGANIIDKRTNQRPEFIDSHVIVERNGFNIGIIGVIGDGLESSIAYHRVKDYEFTDAYTAVVNTAAEISDSVDVILVATHADNANFNQKVAKIDKVSAIFNGHSHQEKKGFVYNNDNQAIPWIQSRHNGFMVGRVDLSFNVLEDLSLSYVSGSANNIKSSVHLNSSDNNVDNIIANYYGRIESLYNDVLLTSNGYYSQSDLADYIARLMREVTGSVAGFQNSGGTRATISNGQQITASDLFQIFPFDNVIIVSEIKGSELKTLLNDSYFFIDSDIDYYSINDNQYYKVATNDYVFYSPYNVGVFGNARNIVEFGDMYETFYQVMLNLKSAGYTNFHLDLPMLYD